MTIYGCFDSKDALLEAVVARALQVSPVKGTHEDWPLALSEVLVTMYASLRRRPAVAMLLVTHSLDGPWMAAVRDRLLALIEPAGLGPNRSVDAISALVNYVIGTALVGSGRGSKASSDAFAFGLGLLVDGLRRAAEEG